MAKRNKSILPGLVGKDTKSLSLDGIKNALNTRGSSALPVMKYFGDVKPSRNERIIKPDMTYGNKVIKQDLPTIREVLKPGFSGNFRTNYTLVEQIAVSYLLDIYSGASAAYSVRKLSSTTTNSMRVRRSSDNSEQDIGFVGSDLDTASLLSFVGANDGFVVTLYDQSGNGNDATNASAASQPQVVSSGVVITENGVTNLNFLSNSHKLRSSSASEFTGVTKFSGFNVGSFNTLNVGNQYISGVLTNTNRGFKLGTEGSFDRMRFHYNPSSFGVMNGGTLIANQQQLIAGLYDTNVGNAYINGTSVGSASVTITANTPNYYFIGYSFTSIGGAKKMQEAIFYPSYENANRADIEANINAYYSIYT